MNAFFRWIYSDNPIKSNTIWNNAGSLPQYNKCTYMKKMKRKEHAVDGFDYGPLSQ